MSAILVEADRCPFCTYDRQWLWDKAVPGKFAVACSNPVCAATGPIARTPAEAVLLWNRAKRRSLKVEPDPDYRKVAAEARRAAIEPD